MNRISFSYRFTRLLPPAACAFALGLPGTAPAQVLAPELAQAEAAGPQAQWGLGLGAGYERKIYRDFDNKAKALPLVLYESRWLSVFGPKLDVKLPIGGPVSLRLRVRYAGDGYEAEDSPYLAGMAERKGGVWVGAAAIWKNSVANVAAEALAATGDAEGKRFKLEVNREFRAGAFTVTPRIAADWYDSKYVDYYYGVRADEARTWRPQYSGDSTSAVEVGVRFSYALRQRHRFFVDVSASRSGSAIKDSPLVERATEPGVRLGYLYAF
ncbi:outer membrane scaffolding protein for murein synthesis (MipA/OmpV family) [Pseudoduganella flava]|uniref:MipA/OmpV family protein n=1 Tax=Pseudoduganella flava TaxID=871742 RepID=A0A562PLT1_9BURK|nr:MipA/OmpV family protein [Pseudoduganella flava]QGZ40943.1 MipA/OmpV family protein [Pseudoduganella flava]TWI45377.1 outer membrane scaffolding protein for murein synthesis (MipA/OmpV family) [Pseudoduganella flava]